MIAGADDLHRLIVSVMLDSSSSFCGMCFFCCGFVSTTSGSVSRGFIVISVLQPIETMTTSSKSLCSFNSSLASCSAFLSYGMGFPCSSNLIEVISTSGTIRGTVFGMIFASDVLMAASFLSCCIRSAFSFAAEIGSKGVDLHSSVFFCRFCCATP